MHYWSSNNQIEERLQKSAKERRFNSSSPMKILDWRLYKLQRAHEPTHLNYVNIVLIYMTSSFPNNTKRGGIKALSKGSACLLLMAWLDLLLSISFLVNLPWFLIHIYNVVGELFCIKWNHVKAVGLVEKETPCVTSILFFIWWTWHRKHSLPLKKKCSKFYMWNLALIELWGLFKELILSFYIVKLMWQMHVFIHVYD